MYFYNSKEELRLFGAIPLATSQFFFGILPSFQQLDFRFRQHAGLATGQIT